MVDAGEAPASRSGSPVQEPVSRQSAASRAGDFMRVVDHPRIVGCQHLDDVARESPQWLNALRPRRAQ